MLKNMEPWEISKTEELNKDVAGLLRQKSKLLKKYKTKAKNEKFVILEKLYQICDRLKINYRQLEIFS